MDQNLKEKTLEKLTGADNILIAASMSSNFDGLAAACGLYLSCKKLGKNVSIIAKSPTVGDAQTLYGVDKVGQKAGSRNLVIAVDNAVDTVDKVTYFLENNKLKVVIHPLAGAQGISSEQISVEKNQENADLIFAIGFETGRQLEEEIGSEQNIDSSTWIIALNKNEMESKFAHTHVINPQTTGYSELAAAVVQELALPIDEDVAYNFYSGVLRSTDNFSLSKSTPAVFQVAAWLVKFGASKASFAAAKTQSVPEPVANIPQPAIMNDQKIISDQPAEEDWIKPPKIYKGSESFDR